MRLFNDQDTVTIEHSGIITNYADQEKYEHAKHRLLMKDEYLPLSVCTIVSDFSVANRFTRTRDYILQRVNVFPSPQLCGILDILALDEIMDFREEEVKCRNSDIHANQKFESKKVLTFVIKTTSYHDDIGQYSVVIEWPHQRKQIIWRSQSMSMLLLP